MRTFLLVIALIMINSISFSQDMSAARQRAEEKTLAMKNELGLTADQESKVNSLNIEIEEELEKLGSNNRMSDSDKAARITVLSEKEKEGFKLILSVEQFDRYYSSSEPSKAKINTSRSSIKKN